MTREKMTEDAPMAVLAPLTESEAATLDADLAFLMREDPAPEMSDTLMARVLADAADVTGAVPAVAPALVRKSDGPGLLASLIGFWRPMSAGFAAAALGVWIGWADPAGVTLYADDLILADLSDTDVADFGSGVLEPADLLDLEL